MPPELPTVCVFAPSLFTTVTVEAGEDEFADIHFHLGGQGFWVARMVRELGERPILCAPAGGEAGVVMRGLVASTGLDFAAVRVAGSSPSYVHDRRDGDRVVVATSRPAPLSRHEMDDLFGKTLRHSLGASVCVLTGRPAGDSLEPEFYRRLGKDLEAAGVTTIADFHGEEMEAYLSGGALDVLKVSDEDLASDGVADDEESLWKEMARLTDAGVKAVVVSQGSRGSLASFGGDRFRAVSPEFEVVDHMGAGDSMTAALAVGLVRDLAVTDLLKLACAAGAANVTRHGLGSSQADLVQRLTDLVVVQAL